MICKKCKDEILDYINNSINVNNNDIKKSMRYMDIDKANRLWEIQKGLMATIPIIENIEDETFEEVL